jgi:hypothetical protein
LDFLLPLGYRIGKVTPRGIELYSRWDPERESFREGNYAALREDRTRLFRIIPWWNEHRWTQEEGT